MARVSLTVGDRPYELACRDGEEARLRVLAAIVDARLATATQMLGPTNEARRLLLAALMLADELPGATPVVAVPAADETAGLADALDRLAARLEKLAEMLEPEAAAS